MIEPDKIGLPKPLRESKVSTKLQMADCPAGGTTPDSGDTNSGKTVLRMEFLFHWIFG